MAENAESPSDANPPENEDEDDKMTYLEATQFFLFSVRVRFLPEDISRQARSAFPGRRPQKAGRKAR